MQIMKLELNNFKGYEGKRTFTFPKLGILLGKNGTGKTSVMDAIRYALTGDKGDGDIINKNEQSASVSLTLKNDKGDVIVVKRVEDRNKANSVYLCGKKVTQKNLTGWIEGFAGIPLDRIKVISSQDVLSALSPADFGKFVLSYIPTTVTPDDVVGFLPAATAGEEAILRDGLPASVDIASLDELETNLKDERKSLKKEIARKETLVSTLPEKPAESKADVTAQLKALREADKAYAVYLSQMDNYNRAVTAADVQKKHIDELNKQIAAIKCSTPDEAVKQSIKDEFASEKEHYDTDRNAYSVQAANRDTLKKELERLSTQGVCPLSKRVHCHEDMTPVKKELSDMISATEQSMTLLCRSINKAAERMKELQDKAAAWQSNKNAWDKAEKLRTELNALMSAVSVLPEKPAEVKKSDTTAEENRLNGLLKQIEGAEQKAALATEIVNDKVHLTDVDAVVKALSDKGVIRENFVKKFLGAFESEANSKCDGTPYEFRFTFDKGVVPEMKNSHGTFLRADELSGGEKAFFLFVILSVLNSLTGAKILMLDELSVMDNDVFASFLGLLKSHEADFDTVILSAVDHPDTVELIEKSGIEQITSDASTASSTDDVSVVTVGEDGSEDMMPVAPSDTSDDDEVVPFDDGKSDVFDVFE